MDIEKYAAGKTNGISSIELHGDSTLLIKWPDGFDPETGEAKAPMERGYQPADIEAMKRSALDAVVAAQDALTKAQNRVTLIDDLLADIEDVLASAPEPEKVSAWRSLIATVSGWLGK